VARIWERTQDGVIARVGPASSLQKLVRPLRPRNPASFKDRLHGAEWQCPAAMTCFPVETVRHLLVTSRLANKRKIVLLQNSDDLIGG